MKLATVVVVVSLIVGSPARAELWKCNDPKNPPRFVTTEEKKSEPPRCGAWVEIRLSSRPGGEGTLDVETLEDRYRSSSAFLELATAELGLRYPETAAGTPVPASNLYRSAGRFDVELTEHSAAKPGDVVIYEGLSGILVEARREGGQWEQQVLYPSEELGFALNLADPGDLGRAIGSKPLMATLPAVEEEGQ